MMQASNSGQNRRGFLTRLVRLGCGATVAGIGLEAVPLRRLNHVLVGVAHAGACGAQDVCTVQDNCGVADAAGHACTEKDICEVDASGDCTRDECKEDRSLECTDDFSGCTEDSYVCGEEDIPGTDASGACVGDQCRVDKSAECTNDSCVSDSSGSCLASDHCTADSSQDCGTDSCTADSSRSCSGSDQCTADSSQDCGTHDECVSDQSDECVTDSCTADSSGSCSGSDQCTADSSQDCGTHDECVSDQSGECVTDSCTADSSTSCSAGDTCIADSSGNCLTKDQCSADSSGNCSAIDSCISDSSWECSAGDRCISDSSGECINRDVCVSDGSSACGSDLCRSDKSPDPCAVTDTCALDLASNAVMDRRTLAKAAARQALKVLYGLGCLLLALGATLSSDASAEPILTYNAVFLPDPTYETGASVTVGGASGPFLRDCDYDGVLEADVNADGLCADDPEVKDYNGDDSRELPEGTVFEGSKSYTCFHIPTDVAIIASGPLDITVSREAAVFGAMRVPYGVTIRAKTYIDLRTSAWLGPDGAVLDFVTSLSTGGPSNPPEPEDYVSVCDSQRVLPGMFLLLE